MIIQQEKREGQNKKKRKKRKKRLPTFPSTVKCLLYLQPPCFVITFLYYTIIQSSNLNLFFFSVLSIKTRGNFSKFLRIKANWEIAS